MFDIGFLELALLFVIGLLVLGPERLPRTVRTIGGYLRKARQTWYKVRTEIEEELATEDIKRNFSQPIDDLRKDVASPLDELKKKMEQPVEAAPKPATPADGSKPNDRSDGS